MKRFASALAAILGLAALYFVNLSGPSQTELLVDLGIIEEPIKVMKGVPYDGRPVSLGLRAPSEPVPPTVGPR